MRHYRKMGSFPFVPPPPQYVMRPPVTEHVPLHSKSLCKNMARASGGANNMLCAMLPLSWGGGGGGLRCDIIEKWMITMTRIHNCNRNWFWFSDIWNVRSSYFLYVNNLVCRVLTWVCVDENELKPCKSTNVQQRGATASHLLNKLFANLCEKFLNHLLWVWEISPQFKSEFLIVGKILRNRLKKFCSDFCLSMYQ